ncbi:hypothetical protein CV103_07775 [Sphingomonas fennica]|uniref:Autotransporter domain-containing protein n=2 Tax=Edaphosphingomonas fennica TaxID=114404 RepID=A0A2T4I4I7_9SPHN|nr:hypothetical protein CV103_07775 [Sphingomonas fennica]
MVSAGTLSGRAGDTLTMGSLTLANASTIAVQLGAPSAAALFDVTGDLTLDGRLSITDAGGFGAGGVAVEPFVGIAHVVLDSEAARERGGAAALAVRHDRMATSFATLGARLAHGFDLGGVKADLRTVAGWRHAFGDRTPEAALAFAGGTPFTVTGAPVARNALSADIGLGIALSSQARFDISYAGDIASSTQNHSGRATFSWMF